MAKGKLVAIKFLTRTEAGGPPVDGTVGGWGAGASLNGWQTKGAAPLEFVVGDKVGRAGPGRAGRLGRGQVEHGGWMNRTRLLIEHLAVVAPNLAR